MRGFVVVFVYRQKKYTIILYRHATHPKNLILNLEYVPKLDSQILLQFNCYVVSCIVIKLFFILFSHMFQIPAFLK